jgi:2-keto-4-pentenoate hydratase/2-oxohepta-3-ene-1,7-dioic acid hydratase in catechol pathway
MRLVSFRRNGAQSYGILQDDTTILDLGSRYSGRYPTLRTAIDGGLFPYEIEPGLPAYPSDAIELLLPLPDAGKIICVGRNYRGHVSEAKLQVPDFPSLFIRVADSLTAPGAALIKPRVSDQFDFEGEVAVVIGKAGRHIRASDAMRHVFGYTCFNDGSIRDFQQKQSLTAGKNFWATGSFGPAILTADEVADARDLTIETRLNGQTVQHAKLADLIFDIPFLIEYVSRFTMLRPGDVLSTGTPDGVGLAREPQLWMKAGDSIDISVTGVGTLHNAVEDESAELA